MIEPKRLEQRVQVRDKQDNQLEPEQREHRQGKQEGKVTEEAAYPSSQMLDVTSSVLKYCYFLSSALTLLLICH